MKPHFFVPIFLILLIDMLSAQTDTTCFKHKNIILTLQNKSVILKGEFLGTVRDGILFDQEKIGLFFDPKPKIYRFQEMKQIRLVDCTLIFSETVNLLATKCNEIDETEMKKQQRPLERIFYTQLGLLTAAFPVEGFGLKPGFCLGTALKTIKTRNRASIWELNFSHTRTRVENTPILMYDRTIRRYNLDFNFLYLSLAYFVDMYPFKNKSTGIALGPSLELSLGEFSKCQPGSLTNETNLTRHFNRVEDPGPAEFNLIANSGIGLHLGISRQFDFVKMELRYSLIHPEIAHSESPSGQYSTIEIKPFLHRVGLIWNFEI